MHLDRLAQWAKTLKIPSHHLWFSLEDDIKDTENTNSGMRRGDFLKMSGFAASGIAAGSLIQGNRGFGALTEQDCAQWLAWELWHSKRSSLHESEMPAPVLAALQAQNAAPIPGSGIILRDSEGCYGFAHPSFVDFYVARRVFENIVSGGGALFATAQTSHEMDLILSEFVGRHAESAESLHAWMGKASSPVMRVNSAGVLAKAGATTSDTDRVVVSLRQDAGSRQLYLTAVTSRVLGLPWGTAAQLASSVENPATDSPLNDMSHDQIVSAVGKFAAETMNLRDGAARWCSGIMLGQLQRVVPHVATSALNEALRCEPNPENLRSIARMLAGGRSGSF